MALTNTNFSAENVGNTHDNSGFFTEKTNKCEKVGNSARKSQEKPKKKSKKKKKYRVDVRMPNGKRVTKSFDRKYDADKFKARLLMEKEQVKECGVYTPQDLKLKEFAKIWFEEQVKTRRAVKTQLCYRSDLKNYILPLFGEVKISHIKFNHVRKLENTVLQTGKSARTVNKVVMILKTILNDAVKLGHLPKSPIKGYPPLKEEPRHLTFWDKQEIKQFLEINKNDPLIDFYIVALNTGLRLGEICGLCWDRVDFNGGNLVINRSLTREGLRNTTKSHKGRYVPMNSTIRPILEKRFKTKISEYVFCTDKGKPLPYEHVTQRSFKKAQKRAGLTKIIRFHDLRHTFASHFMMNGGNIYTLQKLLGHSDISTTMIYAHLDDQFMKQATEILNFS